ncbi:MAG: DNA cytosine methyltransferase [Myxococcales bacterium]|nr:DNA cytosine methyltransferase [Myxococcales bacterium]
MGKVLTVVDLFCGAGGLSLGLHAAGFRHLKSIDHNSSAVETYARNLGAHVEAAEITEDMDLPSATLIAGGPPCQGFSSAGMRRTGDDRNTLVSVFAKIVARQKPLAFLFENVEGFLTGEDGSRVIDLLGPLINAGYHIHLRKVNVANFGVPQNRKRVIAIGGLHWAPTFPPPTHAAFGSPGATLVTGDLPATPTVSEAFRGLPRAAESAPGTPQGHFAPAITGDDLKRVHGLKQGQTMRDLPPELWHESFGRRAYRRVKDGTPTERRGGAPHGIRRLYADQPSKAITSFARNEFIHPTEDRFLTLRECARIQTFPDDFVFSGKLADQALLIGNAVPPLFAEQVAKHLAAELRAGVEQSAGPGRLLSFVPTMSTGMSPALQRITTIVRSAFLASNDGKPKEGQLQLWG